jgi:hypothetical protein
MSDEPPHSTSAATLAVIGQGPCTQTLDIPRHTQTTTFQGPTHTQQDQSLPVVAHKPG